MINLNTHNSKSKDLFTRKLNQRNQMRQKEVKNIITRMRKKNNCDHFIILSPYHFEDISRELISISLEIAEQNQNIYNALLQFSKECKNLRHLKLYLESNGINEHHVRILESVFQNLSELLELQIVIGFGVLDNCILNIGKLKNYNKLEKLLLTIRPQNNFNRFFKNFYQNSLPKSLKTFYLNIDDHNNLINANFPEIFPDQNYIEDFNLIIGSRNNFNDSQDYLLKEMRKLNNLKSAFIYIKNGNQIQNLCLGLVSNEIQKLQILLGQAVNARESILFKIIPINLEILRLGFEGFNKINNLSIQKLSQTLSYLNKLKYLNLKFGSFNEANNYQLIANCISDMKELKHLELQFGQQNKIKTNFIHEATNSINKMSHLQKFKLIIKQGHRLQQQDLTGFQNLFRYCSKLNDIHIDIEPNQITSDRNINLQLLKNIKGNVITQLHINLLKKFEMSYNRSNLSIFCNRMSEVAFQYLISLLNSVLGDFLQYFQLEFNSQIVNKQNLSVFNQIWKNNLKIKKIKIHITKFSIKKNVQNAFQWFLQFANGFQFKKIIINVQDTLLIKKVNIENLLLSKYFFNVKDSEIFTDNFAILLASYIKTKSNEIVTLNLISLSTAINILETAIIQLFNNILQIQNLLKLKLQFSHINMTITQRISSFNKLILQLLSDRLKCIQGYYNLCINQNKLAQNFDQLIDRLSIITRTQNQIAAQNNMMLRAGFINPYQQLMIEQQSQEDQYIINVSQNQLVQNDGMEIHEDGEYYSDQEQYYQ